MPIPNDDTQHAASAHSAQDGSAAEARIAQLEDMVGSLGSEIASLRENEIALKRQIAADKDEIESLRQRIRDFETSNSWRVGRAVTLLPRIAKDIARH